MYNRYPPYRRGGIRFFPHIFPIAFPLIFPFGIGLVFGLFHLLLPLIGILVFAALVFFIVRAVTLGSSQAAWNSMRDTGNQWQQRFTGQRQQQPPYYQPQQSYYQPQQPYYQPSSPTGQEPQQPAQPYGQGYQSEQPYYYRPTQPSNNAEQPQAHYPEQMPPMQQS